jgi:hypothetical protein
MAVILLTQLRQRCKCVCVLCVCVLCVCVHVSVMIYSANKQRSIRKKRLQHRCGTIATQPIGHKQLLKTYRLSIDLKHAHEAVESRAVV